METHLIELAKYVFALGGGFLGVFFLVPFVIRLAPVIGMIDMPDARRVHVTPTPRGGGMAVFVAFHLVFWFVFSFLVPDPLKASLNYQWWLSFLAASSVLFITGVIDDIFQIRALIKLLLQILSGVLLFMLTGKGVGTLLGFQLPYVLDIGLTVFWYISIINAFNLIDGLDGLCSGLATIASLGLALGFIINRSSLDSVAPLVLVGCCLGFLRYNFHPAKIFLGDTGSMFLGFALAAFALQASGKSTLVVSLGVPLLVSGIPLFDTALAIWRRSAKKFLLDSEDATKVMGADKRHLHHRLLDMGLSQRKVAGVLYGAAALLVLVALSSVMMQKQAIAIYLLSFSLAVYVVVRHVAHAELWDTGMLIQRGLSKPRKRALFSYLYVGWDLLSIAAAMALAFFVLPIPEIDSTLGTKREWIMWMPFWVLPIFGSLFLGQIYQRVWIKAGLKDFLALQVAFMVGWILVLCLQAFNDGGLSRILVARMFVFGGVLFFLLNGARSLGQLVQVIMLNALAKDDSGFKEYSRRVLLYGTGPRGLLYLKERYLVNPEEAGRVKIMGILDCDPHFRKRIVRGYPVLGGMMDLERLLKEGMALDEIVLSQEVEDPKRLEVLEKLSKEYHFSVVRWFCVQRAVF